MPSRPVPSAAFVFAGMISSLTFAASLADVPPPGKYFKLAPDAHKNAESFKSGQPIVGTSYFYWYDIHTGAHIHNADGTDALTTHPPKAAMADLSFRSPDWHCSQLRDIREAGIDFIMPVYWGVPGQYDGWSFAGLPPLVAAHDRMLAEHKKKLSNPLPPKIGLFYDTSTLQWNHFDGPGRSRHIDLTTARGREWFYVTIRDYFSLIPPDKWARVDGKPIVFLYGANFAKAVDDKLFDDVRTRFKKDFGTALFLVRHADWPGRSDAWYQWGGALRLTLGDHVAGIGPGYDHGAVPGRKPLVVDRDGGRFYDRQWEQLLRMQPDRRPWLVHVETWNEWHEGTDIARSEHWGDLYIRKTARYTKLFRDRARVAPSGPFAKTEAVRWTSGKPAGVTLRPNRGDGRWESRDVDGTPAVVSVACKESGGGVYLYFDVDDSFLFDEAGRTVELTVVFRDDGGCDRFHIEYDNNEANIGPREGAFRPTRAYDVGKTGAWQTVTLPLPDVRFLNRTNGGDLRLAIKGGSQRLTVREVVVRRLPGR